MGLTYFKRFRMEIGLAARVLGAPTMPEHYRLVGWNELLLDAHAETKYRCFRQEMDANIFPSLGTREGCRRLMREISRRDGFLPETTWLLQHTPAEGGKAVFCGTIQGLRDRELTGAIQNIGVTTPHRGLGLGTCLLRQALLGFQAAGIYRVSLEVTARNHAAQRLYRRLGFQKIRTVYKTAEVAFA